MLSQIQQEADLWEIWIEYDPSGSGYFGTLYVLGEIPVNGTVHGTSYLKRTDAEDGKVLKLVVPGDNGGKSRMKEVFYAEPVKQLDQYSAVQIFAGNEMIASLEEIEVMI